MGAENVGGVLTSWPGRVSQRALLVLVAMAHLSLDKARPGQAPRRYFAGPGYLAEVLYGPDGIDRVERGEAVPTDSAGRQVRKCLTELERAGAIRRVVKGAPGRRSEYEVAGLGDDYTRTAEVQEHRTAEVRNTGPQRSTSRTAEVPLRTTEEDQDHYQDNPSSTHHVQTRTTTTPDTPDVRTGDHYADALAHLGRTIGHGPAGDLVVDHLNTSPDDGYRDAVLAVAHQNGWTTA